MIKPKTWADPIPTSSIVRVNSDGMDGGLGIVLSKDEIHYTVYSMEIWQTMLIHPTEIELVWSPEEKNP
jgi:hypothetical protein